MNVTGFEKHARKEMVRCTDALLRVSPADAVEVAKLQATHGTWKQAIDAAKQVTQSPDDDEDGL